MSTISMQAITMATEDRGVRVPYHSHLTCAAPAIRMATERHHAMYHCEQIRSIGLLQVWPRIGHCC
jgi:hypothetical protein